jgi:predicted dehydrogenase
LKAVYSRSQSSAETFVAAAYEDGAIKDVEAYFDSPFVLSKSLNDLLRRDDIAAVIVAVAIDVSPVLIKKALAAGKHVLSEKPIAPDLKIAQSLVDYSQQMKDVLWGVGENFRFWNSVHRAAKIIEDLDANLLTFSVTAYSFTDAKNPFYHSDWYVIKASYCRLSN